MRDLQTVLEQSSDDEVYESVYKPDDDVIHDVWNKSAYQ